MRAVVVAAPPVVRTPKDLALLPAAADWVELRLDLLPGPWDEGRLRGWIAASPRPVLVTVRSRPQGGAFDGPPEQAAVLLRAAARAGADGIDVEPDVAARLADLPPGLQVVASVHGAVGLPAATLPGGRAVDFRKVARPVATPAALARVRQEALEAAPDLTVLPYGPLGGLRAAFVHPHSLLFGSGAADAAVVAGQPPLLELLDDLRAGEVGPDAALYGLVGTPPARSPSPSMHNAVFRALGRRAIYLPLPGLTLDEAMRFPLQGLSVTTPWKEEALRRARHADGVSRTIGAANTLVRNEDGSWRAANTDAEAIRRAVAPARAGARAFVYGTGGYARAACLVLEARGYEVRIGGRSEVRGRELTAGRRWSWAGPRYVREDADAVLVNATPAGADGRPPAFVEGASLEGLDVLDAPYAAPGGETGLSRRARLEALSLVDGRRLLRLQAEGQVRLFTGSSVDPAVLDLALEPPLPLVLLGLRGAGKSTVGRTVARRLGRPFLDLDDEVERITGRPPAAWIRESGEAAFRAVETLAVERLVDRRGVVAAAGGGVLESARARHLLERATTPVFLDADPDVAAARVRRDARERPFLAGAEDAREEARVLDARRRDAWISVAHRVFDASRPLEEVVDDVVTWWSAAPPRPTS